MDAPATALSLRLPTFAIGSAAENARALPSCCRAAASSSAAQSRPSTLSVKQAECTEHAAYVTSRRCLLGLLGAISLNVNSATKESAAMAAPSCEFTVAPSGLGFCDTSSGTGSPASQGMLIKANYVGRLEDGKVFDSSYDRGKPLTFKIGVGQVIKGWDEGILGGEGVPPMLAGGKRRLRIPPQLGYGDRGAGCRAGSCVIPPNSVLLFDVEFVGKAF